MKIILLGPPGAGKGTQAKIISNKFNIPHISTGDIFRKNIKENTLLGMEAKSYLDKGMLVPDELTLKIVYERLNEKDCEQCYLLDGFPRTLKQAEALQKLLEASNSSIDKVILLRVPKEVILERGTGRRICSSCSVCYHIKLNPPQNKNLCDHCGNELFQRDDDKEATINKRLDMYETETVPLISYYEEKKLLSTIDGSLSIDIVYNMVNNILSNHKF